MANEVVKYSNELNTVVLKGFSDTELSLLFVIFSKLKDKGASKVTISFDQFKELTHEKKHYTASEYAEIIDGIYHKLVHMSYRYNDGKDRAGEFNLFQGYERSIANREISISVTPMFLHYFNSLTREFTRFELQEIMRVRGKSPKLLYRQLKQWRMVGQYSVTMNELRELLDVPDSYETKDVTKKIIVPSVNKLHEIPAFSTLTYNYSKRGKTIVRVVFTWYPEKGLINKNALPSSVDTITESITDNNKNSYSGYICKDDYGGDYIVGADNKTDYISSFPKRKNSESAVDLLVRKISSEYDDSLPDDWDENLPF